MPKGGERVQACECKERVRQIPMNILGGAEDRAVFF